MLFQGQARKVFVACIALSVLFSTQAIPEAHAQTQSTFTDSRDSQRYDTVHLGDQVWMAENLNYASPESQCYDNDSQNCDTYGALYSWHDATADTHGNSTDICPSGWHLPTDEEWQTLEMYAGLTTSEAAANGWRGSESADTANNLKSTSDWRYVAVDGNGNDRYGFTILSAGRWRAGPERFRHLGEHADFWTSTELSTTRASNRKFTSGKPQDHRLYNGDDSWRIDRGTRPKIDGHSVRCVMNDSPGPTGPVAATVYQHCSYGGYSVTLQAGSYTLQDLQALGIRNDDISSLRVEPGYRVTMYRDDNLSGISNTRRFDDSCFVPDGFNDTASSIVVSER